MTTIKLFTTEGCHLCEQAELILQALAQQFELNVISTEIGDNDELVAQYGIRIPVLRFSDNSELDWPFSGEEIVQKINNI